MGLNPCSNGRYAQRYTTLSVPQSTLSLNPCSNGRYSQRGLIFLFQQEKRVLILVLMEDTLRVKILQLWRQLTVS